jgi:hypothetical protein
MNFESRSGLDLMTRPQDGHPGPDSSTRESAVEVLRCDVTEVATDAVAVDALARLALTLRRRGLRLQLCGASEELCALMAFMGLAEVLMGGDEALSGQRGQAEQREEGVGGEEEGEL